MMQADCPALAPFTAPMVSTARTTSTWDASGPSTLAKRQERATPRSVTTTSAWPGPPPADRTAATLGSSSADSSGVSGRTRSTTSSLRGEKSDFQHLRSKRIWPSWHQRVTSVTPCSQAGPAYTTVAPLSLAPLIHPFGPRARVDSRLASDGCRAAHVVLRVCAAFRRLGPTKAIFAYSSVWWRGLDWLLAGGRRAAGMGAALRCGAEAHSKRTVKS